MVELFGFLQTETLGRRSNHPSDGFSGLRPLARLRRAAARSLPLNKAKKEKRHTLPTMG
jgi:hypothetical protein